MAAGARAHLKAQPRQLCSHLPRAAVGRTHVLLGCWTEGLLRGSLTAGQRPPLSREPVPHGSLLPPSTHAEKDTQVCCQDASHSLRPPSHGSDISSPVTFHSLEASHQVQSTLSGCEPQEGGATGSHFRRLLATPANAAVEVHLKRSEYRLRHRVCVAVNPAFPVT